MRVWLLLVALAGCVPEVDDLGDETKPSAGKRCDQEIQGAGDKVFTLEEYNQAYQRCLHGTAAPGDGGATD